MRNIGVLFPTQPTTFSHVCDLSVRLGAEEDSGMEKGGWSRSIMIVAGTSAAKERQCWQ